MAWSIAATIVIDHTKVAAAQTNFPLLFSGAYFELRSVPNGGNVQNVNGYDIIFASDSLGASPLSFERVAWQPFTGAIEAWVGISSLSASANTTIYILAGNAAITTDQQTPASVWDANFKGVWHLRNQSLQLSITDTTGNLSGVAGNNGITLPLAAAAKFGVGGANFGAGGQGIYLPSVTFATFTVSAWINITGVTSGIIGGFVGAMEFRVIGTQYLDITKQQVVTLGNSSPNAVALNTWTYVGLTYNGSTGAATFYMNAAAVGSLTNIQTFNTGNHVIGNGGFEGFQGVMDELHYSNSLRPQSWLQTEYNNQNSPSTFYTTTLTTNPTGIVWGPFPATSAIKIIGPAAAGGQHQPVKAPALVSQPSSGNPVPVSATLVNGVVGTAYSQFITAVGGTSPYTFAITSGALPAGLSMSSSGAISGTPTASGSSVFTVTVTDALSQHGSQSYTLVIESATGGGGGAANYGFI